MRKYRILYILLIQSLFVLSQNKKEISNYLPNYTPPSPTVAALMKFEEVPVDNYTGIPDVSIPIFSTTAKDKKLPIDISLKYHASSVAVDEIASDVGLGWSLFAGGTVSRTVKDLPDEMLIYEKRVGIYQTTVPGSANHYYRVVDILANGVQNEQDQYDLDEFLWEANEKHKYDTQHDLWQFNFMGYSGRFYIKKNMANGVLEVVPLDNYNLKIENLYHTTNVYPSNVLYNPEGFIITDTQGYKYYFEVYEESRIVPFSYETLYPNFSMTTIEDPVTNKQYRSSFHLTKVTDMEANILVEFSYSNFTEKVTVSRGMVQNFPISTQLAGQIWQNIQFNGPDNICPDGGEQSIRRLEPQIKNSMTTNNVYAKKLNDIIIYGVAKIHFNFDRSRLDSCYHNEDDGNKLTDITISNWNPNPQLIQTKQKYQFKYNYHGPVNKRLFLTGIDMLDKNLVKDSAYGFNYENEGMLESSQSGIGKDYWGYYNITTECNANTPREVTPRFCTTDVLQKIKLPTGGCKIFNYEPNEYSFLGADPLDNFDENIDNWDIQTDYLELNLESTNGSNDYEDIGYYANETKLIFNTTVQENNQGQAGLIQLYKSNPSTPNTKIPVSYLQEGCPVEKNLEGGFQYWVGFKWDANAQIGSNPVSNLPDTGHCYVSIDKITRKSIQKNALYGGGIRINKIGYFDVDVNQDYYKQYTYYSQSNSPSKEKIYSYRLKSDTTKSSGVLVFPKPIYEYYKEVKTCIDCGNYTNVQVPYKTQTNYNNLMVNKTKGSDVGYKNVTVSETGNGRTDFEYTTSIDFPELAQEYSSIPPFLPLENYDFRRGLLLSQEESDNTGKPLLKVTNEYAVEQYTQNTGFNVFSRSENILSNSSKYSKFDIFNGIKEICKNSANVNYNCPPHPQGNPFTPNESLPVCPCHCYNGEEVSDFINFVPIVENYGWIKLESTINQDYFYDSNNTQRIVERTETYTYNNLNRNVETKTESTSTTPALITNYYYAKDPAMSGEPYVTELKANNIIETPLNIQTFRGGTKLSEQKTIYNNWSISLLLPQIIKSSKGLQSLEDKVHFDLYDKQGHPLQVRLENGTPVSYIWGYNSSQIIAKIENCTYNSLSTNLILAAQNASNISVTGTESNLLTALKAIRDALPNAMVSTYTYISVVGVSTITDPKGYTTTYEYDSVGRLSVVKDHLGNKLSENEYHYRP